MPTHISLLPAWLQPNLQICAFVMSKFWILTKSTSHTTKQCTFALSVMRNWLTCPNPNCPTVPLTLKLVQKRGQFYGEAI